MRLIVFALIVCLSACSYLPKLLSGALDSGGVHSDIQAGDRKNAAQIGGASGAGEIHAEDDAVVTVTTSQSEARIDNAENVHIENIPFWVLLLLLLGWVLPTPSDMFKGFSKWLQTIRQRLSNRDSGQKPQ